MITDGERVLEVFGRADRRQRKMDRIDSLSPELRAVVHEFGWATVKEMMAAGVTKPKLMRHLIHIVLFEQSHEYRSRFENRHIKPKDQS